MAQASLAVGYDRVLADAAFDSEASHRYCREELGVRSTVIPLNRRGQGRKWPRTRYRRQMVKRFRKRPRGSRYRRVYGQRWQAESTFSRHKHCSDRPCAASRTHRAKARVLPACTHPQPHAPRRYRVEGFNRATLRLTLGGSDAASYNESPIDRDAGSMEERPHEPTETELTILQVLWDRGPSTIRRITDILYPRRQGRALRHRAKTAGTPGGQGPRRARPGKSRPRLHARTNRDDLVGRRLRPWPRRSAAA